MIRHFLNPPNWFTSASIFCSTYAITLLIGHGAEPATLSRAALLVVFGGIFDLLDGRVARMTNRSSAFGVQLDSLADVISFGVAPAMLVWTWRLQELGLVGALVAFWFVLCAAFRLARFNVNAESTNPWPFEGHSQGLTSTMAGGSLVTAVWVANGYLGGAFVPSPVAAAVVVGALGLLMVSNVPFRTFKDVRRNRTAARMFAVAMAACAISAVALDVSMLFGMGAILYMTWGLADGLGVMVLQRRRLRAAISAADAAAEADAAADEASEEEAEPHAVL